MAITSSFTFITTIKFLAVIQLIDNDTCIPKNIQENSRIDITAE